MKKADSKQILRVIKKLDESQTRWYIAREAISLGRGGIKKMNKITGISRTTIIKGIKAEIETSTSKTSSANKTPAIGELNAAAIPAAAPQASNSVRSL